MKIIIITVVVALLAWAGYAMFMKDAPEVASPVTTEDAAVTAGADASADTSVEIDISTGSAVVTEVKEFVVTGNNFAFAPSTMRVNKGDRVRIVFNNTMGTHDWVIDEFNARTKVLNKGQSETIEFVADKSGTFEYYCSIGSHRQMGMKGTLTVE